MVSVFVGEVVQSTINFRSESCPELVELDLVFPPCSQRPTDADGVEGSAVVMGNAGDGERASSSLVPNADIALVDGKTPDMQHYGRRPPLTRDVNGHRPLEVEVGRVGQVDVGLEPQLVVGRSHRVRQAVETDRLHSSTYRLERYAKKKSTLA